MILTNADIVLPDRVVSGSLVIENGIITEISTRTYAGSLDLNGAMLSPGLIDIHSDHIEKELSPRPSSAFPLELALHMTDLRALSCGLTTVLSAARFTEQHDGLGLAKAMEIVAPKMKANHLLHLRWDPHLNSVTPYLAEILKLSRVGNLVYNDEIPGERQHSMETLSKREAAVKGISLSEAQRLLESQKVLMQTVNNRHEVQTVLGKRIPLGSHDDSTADHVIEAHKAGASLCEMPVTLAAAAKARELGMMICMGAPNYFRGGSALWLRPNPQ